MASTESKQELIDDIKRPIRHYRITMTGYGGEAVYGKSSKEEYDYWVTEKEQRLKEFKTLEDEDNPFQTYMWDKAEEIPEKFKREFDWYEYDELEHVNGPDYNSARIEIVEVDSDDWEATELETVVDSIDLDEFLDTSGECVIEESEAFNESFVFYGMSVEKGTFFEGVFTTIGKIDLSKLKFSAVEIPNGDTIVHNIEYDGESIDNYGGDTNGKALYIELLEL